MSTEETRMYDKHTKHKSKHATATANGNKFERLIKEANKPSSKSGLDAAKQIVKNKVHKGLAQ